MTNQKFLRVLIHWPTFGPYHIARIKAAEKLFRENNAKLLGFEISRRQETYVWGKPLGIDDSEIVSLFPNHSYEDMLSQPLVMIQEIWRSLKQLNPDIIAVNGYSTIDSWAIIIWAVVKGRKLILMTDSKADDQERKVGTEFVKRIILRVFSAAFCAGKPHKQYLMTLNFPENKIIQGYDVVDNDFFRNGSLQARENPGRFDKIPGLEITTSHFFLACSRLIPRKNIDGLVNAFSLYKQLVNSSSQKLWRLIIIGDGDQKDNLVQLIQENNLTVDITMAGTQALETLPGYYSRAGVFIHPAKQDQWGLVVNEAMASGLPVLVSKNCGCAQDLLVEGLNGLSFNPENPEELAMLMMRMTSGNNDLVAMGKNSLEVIKNWGLERFAIGLYQACLIAQGVQ